MATQVLVVDDDESVRYSLCALLEDEGYNVYTAASGEAAVQLLQSAPFQAVLADIWMPGMSGLDLLAIAHTVNPDLPVILMTGNASLDSSIEAVNRGASGYLLKPYSPEAVIAALSNGIKKAAEAHMRQFDEQKLLKRYQTLENYLSYLQGSQQAMNAETIMIISELIRGLRHELGNLATVLNLDVSLLEQTMGANWDKNRIHELKDNVDDLGRLLTRLKDYPEPTARLEPVDLNRVVLDAVEHARKQSRSPHTLIECQLPEEQTFVNGDEAGLYRVLSNVLDNALEANRQTQGQMVRLTLTVVEREAVLSVTDQGSGFAPALLNAPFSPAYTTKITDGFMRGLGMGLFVSNAIISLHGGTITLLNNDGGGALVKITLPTLDEQAVADGE